VNGLLEKNKEALVAHQQLYDLWGQVASSDNVLDQKLEFRKGGRRSQTSA
jgi:hypothetical protein